MSTVYVNDSVTATYILCCNPACLPTILDVFPLPVPMGLKLVAIMSCHHPLPEEFFAILPNIGYR